LPGLSPPHTLILLVIGPGLLLPLARTPRRAEHNPWRSLAPCVLLANLLGPRLLPYTRSPAVPEGRSYRKTGAGLMNPPITRKYAIPLLEYLDRERVTRRVGDERVIL
jgi:Elongation factor SelB, winged helix